jgi:hypothetical protein
MLRVTIDGDLSDELLASGSRLTIPNRANTLNGRLKEGQATVPAILHSGGSDVTVEVKPEVDFYCNSGPRPAITGRRRQTGAANYAPVYLAVGRAIATAGSRSSTVLARSYEMSRLKDAGSNADRRARHRRPRRA